MSNCILHRACLVGADPRGADLSGADMSSAELTGVNLSETVTINTTLNDTW